MQRTLAFIKPDLWENSVSCAAVIGKIQQSGFKILQQKQVKWSVMDAQKFYKEHQGKRWLMMAGKPFFYRLTSFMSSAPFVAMELEREDCIAKWREMIGKSNPVRMRMENAQCLRAIYGISDTRNAFHGSGFYILIL